MCRYCGGLQATVLWCGSQWPKFWRYEEGGLCRSTEAQHTQQMVLRPGKSNAFLVLELYLAVCYLHSLDFSASRVLEWSALFLSLPILCRRALDLVEQVHKMVSFLKEPFLIDLANEWQHSQDFLPLISSRNWETHYYATGPRTAVSHVNQETWVMLFNLFSISASPPNIGCLMLTILIAAVK